MTQGMDARCPALAPKTNSGQAFGLHFRSFHSLPELSSADCEPAPDAVVDLDWGEPAPGEPTGCFGDAAFHCSDNAFHLQIPGIASYQVTTSRIAITPEHGADDRSIRAFLFGSAIGALLQMRGLMVLHGSAIAMPDGKAAVFCGHSTAGKSTLAAALATRGHPALADDITAVRFDTDGVAWCLPGLARTKLWRDALETLGLAGRADATTRVMPEIDKHSLHLATSAEPARLRRFYELQTNEGGGVTFSPASGMDKLNLLLTHTYRPAYLQAMGRQPTLLRNAAALAPRLLANRIMRPLGQQTLDTIVSWLDQQWASSQGDPP